MITTPIRRGRYGRPAHWVQSAHTMPRFRFVLLLTSLWVAASSACSSPLQPEPVDPDAQKPEPSPTKPQWKAKVADVVLAPQAASVVTGSDVRPEAQPEFASADVPNRRAPPLSGGTLRVLADGVTAVASDPDHDKLWVVDLTKGLVVAEVPLQPGDEPGRIVQDKAGRVHTVLRGGGAVLSFAPGAWAVPERRAVCPAPRGIAVDPSERLIVACAGGQVVFLPAQGGAVVKTIVLDRDLRDVIIDGDNIVVTRFRSAELLVLGANDEVTRRLSPPVSLNLTRRHRSGPGGPASTRFLPNVAWRAVAWPGGGVLMSHQRAFTGEIPLSAEGASGYAGSDCGGLIQSVVSLVGAAGKRAPSAELGAALLPVDLAVSRDGQRMAVVGLGDAFVRELGSTVVLGTLKALAGTEEFGCINQSFREGPSEPTWREPDEPPSYLVVNRLRGAQATAIDFDGTGQIVVQLRQPAELRVPKRGLVVRLEATPISDVGHDVFHSTSGGGLACASCHPEGGDDGHVWRFEKLGLRRTQSLRGGVATTAPFHWDGDMKDLPHIFTDVFTGRMGGPVLDGALTAAASSWIDGIPAAPAADGLVAGAVARGRIVFDAAGCGTCHSGTRFTNNKSADVGTGGAFQVPSLLGVGARLPLMHDGCAKTLATRFDANCGGGEQHGHTADLSAAARADLNAFLESL